MKKIMIVAAAALWGTVAFSVESGNVVGYQTIALKNGFNMIGVNFTAVGGEEVAIQDLFDTSLLTQGANVGAADQIQVWDDENKSFTTYFYRSKVTTGAPANRFSDGPGWVENATGKAGTKTTAKIPVGKGFWFKRVGADVSIPLSGQVLAAASTNQTLYIGFNMIAAAYPNGMPLNGENSPLIANATEGANVGTADQIQVWDDSAKSFTTYFYRSKVTTGAPANRFPDGPGWVENATGKAGTKTPYVIPAGKGFWYNRRSTDSTIPQTTPVQ